MSRYYDVPPRGRLRLRGRLPVLRRYAEIALRLLSTGWTRFYPAGRPLFHHDAMIRERKFRLRSYGRPLGPPAATSAVLVSPSAGIAPSRAGTVVAGSSPCGCAR